MIRADHSLAAGIADQPWTLDDIVAEIAPMAGPKSHRPYKKRNT